jgi:predicted dehydrogenase
MTRLGFGLIGGGKHGVRYAQHLARDLPDARLVALARRDLAAAREQAGAFDCRAYADYHDLIADPDVDAVVVVVPPTLHSPIVAAAAAHGRAVLLEKPAATSLAEGRRILEVVRTAGIPLMVAQTLRYNSVVRCLLKARERLGAIHALCLSQRFEPSRLGWIDDPAVAGGGVTLHTGIHGFDLVRVLSGLEAQRVSCEMGRVHTTRTEDNFGAVIRLGGNGVIATVAGSRATAGRCGTIEIAGAHGQLIADHVFNTAAFVRGTVATPLPVAAAVPTVLEVLRAFTAAVRAGRPMPIPLEDGLRAVAIADACYRAASSGRAEPVEALL